MTACAQDILSENPGLVKSRNLFRYLVLQGFVRILLIFSSERGVKKASVYLLDRVCRLNALAFFFAFQV